jgi:hypothetical protein
LAVVRKTFQQLPYGFRIDGHCLAAAQAKFARHRGVYRTGHL